MRPDIAEIEVRGFVSEFWNDDLSKLNSNDIFRSLGITGDDCEEFLSAFGDKFSVNFDKLLWYFHYEEEWGNFGGLFFSPPNKRVERIPISVKLLLDSANSGHWEIIYPAHELPAHRYDTYVNFITFLGIPIIFVALSIILKLIGS